MDGYHRRLERVDRCYFLSLDNARMIDRGRKGHLAMFMNHNCYPNCVTQKWTVNGYPKSGPFTFEYIPP